MTNQELLHKGEAPHTAKWQKHVATALWVIFGVVLAVSAILFWADANGWLNSSDATTPGWPTSWP